MIHVTSVAISFCLFLLRGLWMINTSDMLKRRWVKVLPHVNDTVLLLSAIMLALAIQQSPLENSWLMAKVLGLLTYILLGMVALRFGKTRRTKVTAWIMALMVFGYIVLVALTKSPTVF